MTAREMKIKVYSLIEEYFPDTPILAVDDDVKYKINGVINEIQIDLMRLKKIPANMQSMINTEKKTLVNLSEEIWDLYQINNIDFEGEDIDYEFMDDTTIRINDDYDGRVTYYYYKYPELMELEFENDEKAIKYDKEYEFELDADVLEVMPYGVAADLLKMDMISNYGQYFKAEYDSRKAQIDTRRSKGMIRVTGGVEI